MADLGLAEAGALGGDGDVADHGDVRAGGDRVAVDGGDDRNPQVPELDQDVEVLLDVGFGPVGAPGELETVEVEAGGEGAVARAGQDEAAYPGSACTASRAGRVPASTWA